MAQESPTKVTQLYEIYIYMVTKTKTVTHWQIKETSVGTNAEVH